MQRELRAIDVTLPTLTAKTMAQVLEDSLFGPTMIAGVLGALGVLGLSLAGVGLYAVVAFSVSQRTREIGIRLAIGARSGEVLGSVARETASLVGIGLATGIA